MNIGIDVDSTLADLLSSTIRLMNIAYNKKVEKKDISYRDALVDLYKIPKSIILNYMVDAWSERHYDGFHYMKPEELNLSDKIKKLKKAGHEITIITNRTQDSFVDVVEWLKEQNIGYDNFILNGGDIPKLSYPIDILLDDSPKEINRLEIPYGKLFYLRNQPWNQEIENTKNIIRISSVKELVERLTK